MGSAPLDEQLIARILPHRTPFLFVDAVDACNGRDDISARFFLSPDLVFFKGHFPGRPIMPGVLITEALAQTAGLLLGLSGSISKTDVDKAYFLARTDMKFIRPAYPGATLLMHATLEKAFGSLNRFKVRAHVKDEPVASGSLTLAEAP